ncbi:MAG: hypothetical protein RLY57_149 [Candidatus Parcubacteria bacterium]|jgi:hypothetical protein
MARTPVKQWHIVTGIFVVIVIGAIFGNPGFIPVSYSRHLDSATTTAQEKTKKEVPPQTDHLPTPQPVKAIYMSACVVGTPSFRDQLVKVADETEVNAIVIDVKDYSGTLSYKPENPDLLHAWEASKCGAGDMREFLKTLKEKNIYTIARVTVFQDPHFTKLHPELSVQSASTKSPWKDRKGLNFLDVGGTQTWEYIVSIAKDAYAAGFDEINFDYIRYPSDGAMSDAVYTLSTGSKSDQLEKFFSYLHEQMSAVGIVTSADLFGMTTTNTDDLNIGQVLEKALPNFDYIAPMVYPSHYPANFNGWKNPNDHVYDLIHFVMESAVKRAVATSSKIMIMGSAPVMEEKIVPATADKATSTMQVASGLYTKESYPATKLRTWIQDFDYGGTYDIPEVKAQIQASRDVGVDGWMIWAPSNKYTTGALGK